MYEDDPDDDDCDGDYGDGSYSEHSAYEEDNDVNELTLLKEELKLLKSKGYNGGYIIHEVSLCVLVAFPVKKYSIFHIRACGLDPTKQIVCQINFNASPAVYLTSLPQVKDIQIRQSTDTQLDKGYLEDFRKFGLWWTLEQRLYEWLKQNWDALKGAAMRELSNMKQINSEVQWSNIQVLMKNAGELRITLDEKLAYHMLKNSNNIVDLAQEKYFVDEDALERLRREIRAVKYYKDDPSYESYSVLLKVCRFLDSQIENSNKNCIVCGVPHTVNLLKPVVCSEWLCIYQAVELGLGVDLESEIINFPTIVDFLACAAFAGACYGRHFHSPWEAGEFSNIFTKCPSVQEMQTKLRENSRGFRGWLDGKHPNMYNALHWIVSTNRSHLVLLPEEYQIHELTTKHQFLINSTTPEEEEAFQKIKKDCGGSFFAFHGSPLGNWHSILREGLKPKNYTTAYGPGIYMATNAQTSFNYMKQAQGFPNSKFGKYLRVMALCEVADHGTKKDCKKTVHRVGCSCNKNSPHIRIENESYCSLRFLFLLDEQSVPQNCESSKIKDTLERTVEFCRNNMLL